MAAPSVRLFEAISLGDLETQINAFMEPLPITTIFALTLSTDPNVKRIFGALLIDGDQVLNAAETQATAAIAAAQILADATQIQTDTLAAAFTAGGGGGGAPPSGTGYVHVTAGVYDTPTALVKGDVGLGNVDNTSDAGKPVSTAQQTALDAKIDDTQASAFGLSLLDDTDAAAGRATLGLGSLATQSGTFSGTASGTNTGDQTLPVKATGAEVDTGTDDAKFVTAKAIEDSLYVKAAYADAKVADAINDGTTTIAPSQNAVFDALALKQPLDPDLTTIAGLTATTDNFMVAAASAWASRTPAQAKTSLALVKADVGLSSVDNTSDAGKPVSTAQQTALNLKADLASPTFTGTVVLPAVTLGDTKDIAIGSSTGSKIGQSTSKIGFFGAAPAAQPTALTQTYSVASATHPAVTQLTPPAGGTGATAGAYSTAANRDLMIASITAGAADLLALKKFVNQIADQLQALGLLQ